MHCSPQRWDHQQLPEPVHRPTATTRPKRNNRADRQFSHTRPSAASDQDQQPVLKSRRGGSRLRCPHRSWTGAVLACARQFSGRGRGKRSRRSHGLGLTTSGTGFDRRRSVTNLEVIGGRSTESGGPWPIPHPSHDKSCGQSSRLNTGGGSAKSSIPTITAPMANCQLAMPVGFSSSDGRSMSF
jgi:hypothetical protein